MSLKIRIILAILFLSLFSICCFTIIFSHGSITQNTNVMILLGSTAISAIFGPIFLISAIRKYLERGQRSHVADMLIKIFKLK